MWATLHSFVILQAWAGELALVWSWSFAKRHRPYQPLPDVFVCIFFVHRSWFLFLKQFLAIDAFAGVIRAFALTVLGKRGRTGVLAPSQRPSEHPLWRETWKQNPPEHHKCIRWSWFLWMSQITNDHNLRCEYCRYIPIPDRKDRKDDHVAIRRIRPEVWWPALPSSQLGRRNATRIDTAFALT